MNKDYIFLISLAFCSLLLSAFVLVELESLGTQITTREPIKIEKLIYQCEQVAL